jgi:CheY-like chemotaxis protein/nitrogen-specific signal transduction histidine kinase
MSDLAVLAFCLVGTTTYLLAAMRQNRVAAERLEASNEAAEAASRAKSSFVSTISHELRTPMNAVIGLAHALKTASSPVERDERLDLIIRSGEGLMLLLNDVLDLSKVEAGKLSIEARAFDIKDLAQEVADLWSPLASAKGLAFAATYEPDASAWVLGDSGRLRQVVGNLISNAIKFTPAGHVAVRFAHAPARDGCVDLSIEVEDSGIGISAAEESGLFQPFSQANASTSRRYGGTGLGLSISRALVELMGGVLVLRRPSPDGAAFVVRLTLPSSPPAPGRPDAPETAGSLAGARILVVDDNSVNLRVAAILLTALEAKAETASSGAEALQALARADFDLVLLDIHMPDMDGREVLQRIRGGEAGRRGIAVVACTADAMTDQVANLVAAGFDAVQPKPIVPTQLAATINVALAASARR